MILNIHWNQSKVMLRVKPTTMFSTITTQYFRTQGLSSAEFFYQGDRLDCNMTVTELGLTNESDIHVRNAMITDLSYNTILKVKVHISDSDKYQYMCTRAYSVKAGTTARSLISSLRSELGETRPIYILNGRTIIPKDGDVSGISELLAIIKDVA